MPKWWKNAVADYGLLNVVIGISFLALLTNGIPIALLVLSILGRE